MRSRRIWTGDRQCSQATGFPPSTAGVNAAENAGLTPWKTGVNPSIKTPLLPLLTGNVLVDNAPVFFHFGEIHRIETDHFDFPEGAKIKMKSNGTASLIRCQQNFTSLSRHFPAGVPSF